ncbi:MAG: SMI1/KNR4 family protein [Granulosicoccus sp.]
MKAEWNRFESWLKAHFPEGYGDLNEPATDEQISILESKLNVNLPLEFVEFLKIHNGQRGESGWIIGGSELLSVERIIDEWEVWNGLLVGGEFEDCKNKRDNGVKDDWWNPNWVPFTYDGGGNHLCIDLDPAESGTTGQIITMWHDELDRKILATSFEMWFALYVQDVESGKYIYSDDYEAIVNANDV